MNDTSIQFATVKPKYPGVFKVSKISTDIFDLKPGDRFNFIIDENEDVFLELNKYGLLTMRNNSGCLNFTSLNVYERLKDLYNFNNATVKLAVSLQPEKKNRFRITLQTK